jgi:hypothetical protein
MSFLAALYAALMLILNPAALHHSHPRPHIVRLVLPDVPTHEIAPISDPLPRRMGQGENLVAPPPHTEQRPQDGDRPHDVGQPNQQPTFIIPPHIDVTISGHVEADAKIIQQDGNDKKGKGFYDVDITAILIAVFTFVLAIATIGLYIATRNLWKTTEQELRSVHRARVFIEDMKIESASPEDDPLDENDLFQPVIYRTGSLSYTLTNTGSLPATQGQETRFLLRLPDMALPRADYFEQGVTLPGAGAVIAAHGKLSRKVDPPIPLDGSDQAEWRTLIDAVRLGTVTLCVGVAFTYIDGFNQSRTSWSILRYDRERHRFVEFGARHD